MNHILFMPDSLRAESLGCYGHPLVQTPNYDRLASEGTLFNNCYSQHPICGPSRCSIMTGWYPHNTGCRTNEHFLHPHQPSLFKYLKEAGYDIIWFGKNDLYSEDYFTEIVTHSHKKKLPWAEQWQESVDLFEPHGSPGEPGYYNFLQKKSGEKIDAKKQGGPFAVDLDNVHNAVDYLRSDRAKEKPFVLFIPGAAPHPPYRVREPYYSMYDPYDVPPLRPAEFQGNRSLLRTFKEYHDWHREDEDFFRKVNTTYLGMVSFTDALLGMLLDTLDDTGLVSNTSVFAFSDHGDYAGDYGAGHKVWSGMEDPMLRTPMLMRVPGMKEGHKVKELVENFDLMATILDLEGITAEHHHYAKSLVPQIKGAPGDQNRVVFAESGLHLDQSYTFEHTYMDGELIKNNKPVYHRAAVLSKDHPEVLSTSVMLRNAKFKLIYRPDFESELYDMENDPRELNNLYDNSEYTSIRDDLLRQLLNWQLRTSDITPFERDSRPTPSINQHDS